MRKAKQPYIPLYERIKTDKIPLCERTDLTDEQRSKLFTVDQLCAMSSGTLADSIWAPGNEGKLQNRKSTFTPPSSADRTARGSSKLSYSVVPFTKEPTPATLSPNASPFTTKGANTAARSDVQNSSMATSADGQHALQWSAPHAQTKWEESSRIAATVLQQEPAHIVKDASYVPPHLRGVIQQGGQSTLPPHLRPMVQNSQLNTLVQVHNPMKIENTRPNSSSLNTPQHNQAPGAPHMRHASAESPSKQSPDSFALAVGLQSANQASPSVTTDMNQQAAKLRVLSVGIKTNTPEDDFIKFLNRKNALEMEKRTQTKLSPQIPTGPAPTNPAPTGPAPTGPAPTGPAPTGPIPTGPAAQSTLPAVVQMPPAQPANHATRRADFDTKGRDEFLAFLLKKQPVGKVYSAIDSSLDLKDATNQAEIVRSGGADPLQAVAQNGIEKNIPADRKDCLPYINQASPSVTRGDLGVAPSAAAAGNWQQGHTTTGNAGATQNKGNSNKAAVQAPHTWDDTRLLDVKEIHKALVSEIMAYAPPNPNAARLTEESLVKNSGWAPRVRSEDSFCGKVSDSGVEKQKEKVRAEQGIPAAKELLDWDNTWLSPAADWGERYVLDLSFMPNYIREDWAPFVPSGPAVTVDTTAQGFRLGKLPVNGNILGDEVIQPDSIPDIENSENEEKRLRQTAEMDAMSLTKKHRKRNRNADLYAMQSEARHMEIATLELAPHPYAPAIPVYLRPATISDAPGIRAIYNYYVKNSNIPEDQAEILEDDMGAVIGLCKQEKLPFIVAIKGNAPSFTPQSRYAPSAKPAMPQFEVVVGFGFGQTYSYGLGLSGIREGRSRATAELQFYVHPEYTRKGVGRSLLDRLIQVMSPSYAGKDGYEWVNPKNEQMYNLGGQNLWHQLVIQLPVETKDDPTLPWFTPFLAKYWFDQEARLRGFARSSAAGAHAKFLDVVVFAKESSIAMEHSPFL